MQRVKQLLIDNWKPKVASFLVAISIWYLIKSHLDADVQTFPVPGTTAPVTPRQAPTTLDDALLGPLAPPIPGSEKGQ